MFRKRLGAFLRKVNGRQSEEYTENILQLIIFLIFFFIHGLAMKNIKIKSILKKDRVNCTSSN